MIAVNFPTTILWFALEIAMFCKIIQESLKEKSKTFQSVENIVLISLFFLKSTSNHHYFFIFSILLSLFLTFSSLIILLAVVVIWLGTSILFGSILILKLSTWKNKEYVTHVCLFFVFQDLTSSKMDLLLEGYVQFLMSTAIV